MRFREWLQESVMTVYRGTGPEGLKQMRPSEEGAHGPGIYFYDNATSARVYSERDGGIIVAQVDTSLPGVKVIERRKEFVGFRPENCPVERIVVVPDASMVKVVRIIPNDQTSNLPES